MVKKHLFRLAMPKNWQIKRKGITWVARPNPGPHPLSRGMPLVVVMRDMLKLAHTSKEVKTFVFNKEILVDGIRRRDIRFIIGLFDIISIPSLDKHFTLLLSTKNKFFIKEIKKDETKTKLCRIDGKTPVKKKIQLNLYDGKNLIIDKNDFKISDTLILELKTQKIIDCLKFEKGNIAYLVGGKHIGETAVIKDIQKDKIVLQDENKKIFESPKKFIYIIGKDKPLITLK